MPSKCLPNSEWMSGSKEGAGEVREGEKEGEKEKSFKISWRLIDLLILFMESFKILKV